MVFWGKLAKLTSIICISAGSVVSLGSIAMMGIGSQYQVTDQAGEKHSIGSVNYKTENGMNYYDFVKSCKDSLKVINSEIGSANDSTSQELKQIKNVRRCDYGVWINDCRCCIIQCFYISSNFIYHNSNY